MAKNARSVGAGLRLAQRPPWKISVWRKDQQLTSFEIPDHKLGSNEIRHFLHALVVRSRTSSLEEMIPYYVNGRRGSPSKLPFANVQTYLSDDLREQGYWCGEWECHAKATQTNSDESIVALHELRIQNLSTSQ